MFLWGTVCSYDSLRVPPSAAPSPPPSWIQQELRKRREQRTRVSFFSNQGNGKKRWSAGSNPAYHPIKRDLSGALLQTLGSWRLL